MIPVYTLLFSNLAMGVLPRRGGIIGRFLALLNTCDLLLYITMREGAPLPESLGALAKISYYNPQFEVPEVFTAVMFTAVAALLFFGDSRPTIDAAKPPGLQIIIPPIVANSVLAVAGATAIIVIYFTGDRLLEYTDYGSIKSGVGDIDGYMRLVGALFRVSALLLIAMFVPYSGRKHPVFTLLSILVISSAIIVGLAEASRITGVYGVLAAIALFISRRYITGAVVVVLALLTVVYALEARSHTRLGLIYVPEYTVDALSSEGVAINTIANFSNRMLILNASLGTSDSQAYSFGYKFVSFLPTINAVDSFQRYKDQSEQRVLSYIPYSSFAEAYLFGWPFTVFFYMVILAAAVGVNLLSKRGVAWQIVGGSLFMLGWMFCGQYPIRNSIRIFYLIIVLSVIVRWLVGRGTEKSTGFVETVGTKNN